MMGCSQPCEIGDRCFARCWCQRFAGRKGYPKDFSRPELFLHRLAELKRWPDLTGTTRPDKPWLDGLPRLVFLSDLGETFDPALEPEWLARRWRDETRQTVLECLADCPHVLIILTKQPRRMRDFFEKFSNPPNVWLGVSVTTQKSADERVPWLMDCATAVRIISHEPACGPLTFAPFFDPSKLHWLIAGCQSGPRRQAAEWDWFRSDRDQCQASGTAFFLKQAMIAGKLTTMPVLDGKVWSEIPRPGLAE